jgi:ESCRT-I complex subunit VPS28
VVVRGLAGRGYAFFHPFWKQRPIQHAHINETNDGPVTTLLSCALDYPLPSLLPSSLHTVTCVPLVQPTKHQQSVMTDDYSEHLDEDDTTIVELYQSSKERQMYDDQATLYGIILATEHLERAYARDAVTQQEYTTECNKLISQFRLAEKAVLLQQQSQQQQQQPNSFSTTEQFMQLYQLDCPRATERLLTMGVPEPIKGGIMGGEMDGTGHNTAVTVAEAVQHFITTMDAVKLEQRAVDELQPLLSDLMDSLTRLPNTPTDFEPILKLKQWLQKLNALRAVDEIDEEDSRQLYHDLDSAYAEFTRYLKRKN